MLSIMYYSISLFIFDRYICEPVASIADAIQAFERSFYEESRLRKCVSNYDAEIPNNEDEDNENNTEHDLTTADIQDVLHGRVAFPSPPYECNFDDFDDVSLFLILYNILLIM